MKTSPHRHLAIGCCAFLQLALLTGTGAAADNGVGINKAKFASKLVTTQIPGHAIDIDVDITDAKELYLLITDGGNGFGCDWADWVEPRLVGPAGETKLTELKWKSATSGWGEVRIDKNAGGQPLKVAGQPVSYGIGAHANALIGYDLPAGFTRFKAKGALDNGGTDQAGGGTTSVTFAVFVEKPDMTKFSNASTGGGGLEADAALAALDVAEGLEVKAFASEPMILSPSSIDIDARGRVWLCEVVNYRGNKGKRPEGDRILILEDTDGDGDADKEKVFYQGNDVDSAHGVCVLGDKIIVSCGERVIVFTDSNGDDVPDSKENLFTGISGTQHDHGIHAFMFGPDGRLYFNFGNAGRQIKDKDGKPITDLAGNVVDNTRKPYQEGMVFRCEMDGSNFETLGWDFRNNWEVTVDSFGTLWQSDNDDDGNRGVRINYVMEFGNYGYRDAVTGGGWGDKRTNIETEIPLRHWHLNDPGVVPNLLQTGAGSPTGILVYEGSLLPAAFRGQVIHCDAGPNVVRAYPVTPDGAGYKAEILDILTGAHDRWFRPSDVSVAPDGSLLVADWYDPGVGGHAMRDLEHGRVYRVSPPSTKYAVPATDFSSADGAVAALKSPNNATRYLAWTALNKMQEKAKPALTAMAADGNAIYRARAIWLLAAIQGNTGHAIDLAAADKDEAIRCMAPRIARRHQLDPLPTVTKLLKDPSAAVRRDCAIALRFLKGPAAADAWAELALQYNGTDRWYLEALGIGSDLHADECFSAWLKKVGEKGWQSPSGREIVWRTRAKSAPGYLVQIVKDADTPKEQLPKFMRAFDFYSGPEKDQALLLLLQ